MNGYTEGVHFYTADENQVAAGRSSESDTDALTGNRDPFFNFEAEDRTSTIRDNISFVRENPEAFEFESTISNTSDLFENPIEGSIPVYAFEETTLGVHLYTPSAAERDIIEDEFDNYESEGVAYYTFPAENEAI